MKTYTTKDGRNVNIDDQNAKILQDCVPVVLDLLSTPAYIESGEYSENLHPLDYYIVNAVLQEETEHPPKDETEKIRCIDEACFVIGEMFKLVNHDIGKKNGKTPRILKRVYELSKDKVDVTKMNEYFSNLPKAETKGTEADEAKEVVVDKNKKVEKKDGIVKRVVRYVSLTEAQVKETENLMLIKHLACGINKLETYHVNLKDRGEQLKKQEQAEVLKKAWNLTYRAMVVVAKVVVKLVRNVAFRAYQLGSKVVSFFKSLVTKDVVPVQST